MIAVEIVCVAIGAALGALAGLRRFTRNGSTWFVIGSYCVACAFAGAAMAGAPDPSGPVPVFIVFGLLITAASPAWLLLPLPHVASMDDVWSLARRASKSVALLTFYGGVFAIVGAVVMQVFFAVFLRAVFG